MGVDLFIKAVDRKNPFHKTRGCGEIGKQSATGIMMWPDANVTESKLIVFH